jgi:hypothetical protein
MLELIEAGAGELTIGGVRPHRDYAQVLCPARQVPTCLTISSTCRNPIFEHEKTRLRLATTAARSAICLRQGRDVPGFLNPPGLLLPSPKRPSNDLVGIKVIVPTLITAMRPAAISS